MHSAVWQDLTNVEWRLEQVLKFLSGFIYRADCHPVKNVPMAGPELV